MTEGTITPEVQIKQLEEALATETDRLQKLFAAYETQEKELVDAKAEIEVLEKEIGLDSCLDTRQLVRRLRDHLHDPITVVRVLRGPARRRTANTRPFA